MELYPSDIGDKLEYSKVLERLAVYCYGQPAKDLVARMRPYDNADRINRMLDEIQEYLSLSEFGLKFPMSHYESVSGELKLLAKIDYVLEIEQYLKIFGHIRMIDEISRFFKDDTTRDEFPLLYEISEQIILDPGLIPAYERIFSEEGKIKSDASAELARIFRALGSKERELSRIFATTIDKYKKQGYLAESFESIRNSRRVLSVNAESKRRVRGIIHDESSTGKTVFIEPQEILEINNELFELEAAKRQEIYRIMKALSAELRPHIESFSLWQKILARYDLIQAKAFFSKTYNGKRPQISGDSAFRIEEAYHPLLMLINDAQGKETVPFNLELDPEKRILVISGPNAGGKSVTLKALGLNQMMIQSGLLVPVSEQSSMGIFRDFMIDIGDQQSLEGDLSTYSSRLVHMNRFVERAGKKSLILIDEFGSGSDPMMGGAIAEAVLHVLVRKKCFALITTHYSNIKNYAFKSPNILNGAMLFDKKALKPSYRLKVGQPGSSFAFELARKIGMPEEILRYARKNAGVDSAAVDQLLLDLQAERKQLEESIKKTDDDQKRLSLLISSYERMKGELEIRRKKLKKEAREKSYFNISDAEKEIQKLLKEARKHKKEEDLRKIARKVKTAREDTREEIKELNDTIFTEESNKVKTLEVGQYVKLKSGGEPGRVVEFDEKTVKLQMGILNMEVPRTEIIVAGQPIEKRPGSIRTDTQQNPYTVESKLDIRGYSKQEADSAVQEFLDNALMGTATQLKILHGKGSGVLRKLVWEKAREYSDIKKIWHPEEEFGGNGVSFISFA